MKILFKNNLINMQLLYTKLNIKLSLTYVFKHCLLKRNVSNIKGRRSIDFCFKKLYIFWDNSKISHGQLPFTSHHITSHTHHITVITRCYNNQFLYIYVCACIVWYNICTFFLWEWPLRIIPLELVLII